MEPCDLNPLDCSFLPCQVTGQCCEQDRKDERERREWEANMTPAERAGWMRARNANVD